MSVRVSKVEDATLGEVYYVTAQNLPDELSPIRIYVWRCPLCKSEIHAWTLKQLQAVAENHKKKHIDKGGK